MTIRCTIRAPGRFIAGCLAALLGIGAACAPTAQAADAAASDQSPIGLIGPAQLTESSLVHAHQAAFDRLRDDYDTEQHQLEFKYAKARYELLKRQLDEELDAAALEREAKARGMRTETVLAQLKINAPTEEETRAFYEQNKDRIQEPYEEVAPKAREYLAEQHARAAKRAFYDALRAKHGIKSLLGAYRVAVAARGPARGPASAPVTIVEFGDFQCPYCQRAESALRALLEQYPREVRVVFRNLPLAQIHPRAAAAAAAAVCADRQGKFWEMHDAMYGDQSALGGDALRDTAKRIGLDLNQFSACLTDGATAAALDADLKAAQALGLSGTPYFFINGRPVDGNVPLEEFRGIIAEELRVGTPDRG